jgi:hypothetical protein
MTGLEKSGAAPAAEVDSAVGGFGAVDMLLITIGDCVRKRSCGQTFFRANPFADDFRFAEAM